MGTPDEIGGLCMFLASPAAGYVTGATLWADGGGTNRDGMMICPRHHARAHDPAFTMAHLPGGKIAFTRRT